VFFQADYDEIELQKNQLWRHVSDVSAITSPKNVTKITSKFFFYFAPPPSIKIFAYASAMDIQIFFSEHFGPNLVVLRASSNEKIKNEYNDFRKYVKTLMLLQHHWPSHFRFLPLNYNDFFLICNVHEDGCPLECDWTLLWILSYGPLYSVCHTTSTQNDSVCSLFSGWATTKGRLLGPRWH